MKQLVKSSRTLFAMLIIVGGAGTASADWYNFWHSLHIGHLRNNAWPQPFTEADAMDVIAPFEVMKRNGWRVHNTIGHELFREGDGALLAAGHNRINWIATQAPANRRELFVLRGRTDDETQARVAAVRTALSKLPRDAHETPILITDVQPATAPGDWATKVNREMREQMAAPKLPSTSSSGAAGITTASGGSAN